MEYKSTDERIAELSRREARLDAFKAQFIELYVDFFGSDEEHVLVRRTVLEELVSDVERARDASSVASEYASSLARQTDEVEAYADEVNDLVDNVADTIRELLK